MKISLNKINLNTLNFPNIHFTRDQKKALNTDTTNKIQQKKSQTGKISPNLKQQNKHNQT